LIGCKFYSELDNVKIYVLDKIPHSKFK